MSRAVRFTDHRLPRQIAVARQYGAPLALLLPWLILLGPLFPHDRSLAFRDAGRFYAPLFHWNQAEWGAGRIPLWNERSNLGVPALADVTSCVFYPGQLLFALPLPYPLAFKLYITGHVLLASVAAYSALRCWRVRPAAALFAALSYAYGGPVLFDYCNPVYLVSAAWLPWGGLAAERLLVRGGARPTAGFAAVIALMVLGGDPQTAYHLVLAALLLAVFLLSRDRRRARFANDARLPPQPGWLRGSCRRLGRLSVALLLAAALSAVQLLPAAEWGRQSHRRAFVLPRNVYELVSVLAASGLEARRSGEPPPGSTASPLTGLYGHPVPRTHHADIYDFSVGPWQLAGAVWPNLFGRTMPINHRWSRGIPAEGRTWTPSLYVGLIALVLFAYRLRLFQGRARLRWLSWLALLSLAASFGRYGCGWLIHELAQALFHQPPETLSLGAPTGGLYWGLVVSLPGYVMFRYPAKWLIVAAWAVCALGGMGWDAVQRRRPPSLRPVLLRLSAGSLVLAAAFLALQRPWTNWLSRVPGDEVFGPVSAAGATADVFRGLLQAACVAALAAWLLRRRRSPRWEGALVVLAAADVLLANYWFLVTVPDRLLAPRSLAGQDSMLPPRLVRTPHRGWTRPQWRLTSSPQRLEEYVAYERVTLEPRWELQPYQGRLWANVMAASSLHSADYEAVLRLVREPNGPLPAGSPDDLWRLFGVERRLQPEVFAEPAPPAFPRAWIVHQVEHWPEGEWLSHAERRRRTEQTFYPAGQFRDFRREAVIETSDPLPGSSPPTSRMTAEAGDACQLVDADPQQLRLLVTLQQPGLVVMSDAYAPGWRARSRSASQEAFQRRALWRTNRIMRGVWLPPGTHELLLEYRPWSFYLGAVVSVLGLVGSAAGCFRRVRQDSRDRLEG